MGFFKNIFEKKVCDLCGQEIGLLGNRKLEDGNCCKDCAKKLSPWFTDRKHSTVDEIRSQLESREQNRQAVSAFHVTRSIGQSTKVLLDDAHRKFMVTSARDLQEANPDVLDFHQVTACDLDIRESRDEVYREIENAEGEIRKESYSPRRYHYRYHFRMTIRVRHPYIDEMAFSLSGGDIDVDPAPVRNLFGGRQPEGSTRPPTQEEKRSNPEYARCEKWAAEIQNALMQTAEAAVPEAPETVETPAPAAQVTCPWCGSQTRAGKFCTACGGPLDPA